MRAFAAAVAVAAAALSPTAPAAGQAGDGRLVELSLPSPAVGRDVGVRVLLPAGWTPGQRWPLLLLLHGVGDDHTSWTDRTDVEGLTAGTPFVVVMPEAGRVPDAGWYSDWVAGTPAWERFHLDELLPEVERRFGAGGSRERRVVAGFSMGGFGALSYAARHPDLFVGAASFSGAVDTTLAGPGGALAMEAISPYAGTPDDRVWGPYETSEVVWRGHNPTDLATNLRPVALWLRSGNGVPRPGDRPEAAPVEAGVYAMTLSLHDRLLRAGVEHRWHDRGHGTHDWPYREADLAALLPDLVALVGAPPAPPSRFDHRFVEDERTVFGWRFSVTGRAGPAFTELTDVGADGLTAAGSGTLTARAPDGRSVTAVLSSTPRRLVLPDPASPAGRAELPERPTVAAGVGDAAGALPASGPAPSIALPAALLALSLVGRAARRAPRGS